MQRDFDNKENNKENMNRYLLGINEKLTNKKVLLILICLSLFFIIVLSFNTKDSSYGALETEKRIAEIITMTEGVDKAEVMIIYDVEKTDASEKFFTLNEKANNQSREIKGVIIVAENADNYMTKISIINIVKTALNIPAEKIEVVKMKEGIQ